jgi:hypothetical protein
VIGLAIILAGAVMLLIGLATFLAVDSFGSRRLLQSQTERADKLATQLDALRVDVANASTKAAVASEQKQERRADGLEKELADDAKNPAGGGTGLERLHELATVSGGADARRPVDK